MKNLIITPLTLALIFTMSTACGKKKKGGGNGAPPPDPKVTCEAQENMEWKDNQCSAKPTPEEQCNADSAKIWQDGACTDKPAEAATPAPEAAPEANTGEKRTSIFPGFGGGSGAGSWNAICQFLPGNFLPAGTRGLALAGEEDSGGFFGTSRLEWDEIGKSFRERLEVFSSEDCDSNSFLEGFDMEIPFSPFSSDSEGGGFFGGSGFFQDLMKRMREGRGSDSSSSFPFPFPFSSSRDTAE